MSRSTSMICLGLLLLCPILCLAERGEGHRPLGRDCGGEVCEATTVGAVVEKAADGTVSPRDLPSLSDRLLSPDPFLSDSLTPRLTTTYIGAATKLPPVAMRRQSLLQTFLF